MQKCVPHIVKNLNVKVFNLMSRANEKRHIKWHKTCKWEYKFWANVCNNKQCWNKDKCRCGCKELIDKGVFDKGFIWNPMIVSVNLIKRVMVENIQTMKIVSAEKKIVAPLIEECTETADEVKLAKITLAENENSYECASCTVYNVLFSTIFTINIGIVTYYVYSQCYTEKKFSTY